MNLGLKDIAFAKGRFALMAGVIGLISMLLVMLTGLTSGLSNQSVSAIENLPVEQIVFSVENSESPSFSGQQVTTEQFGAYQVLLNQDVSPMGVSSARARGVIDGEELNSANVAVFGGVAGPLGKDQPEGTVLLDADTADALGLLTEAGTLTDNATVVISGIEFTVDELMDPQWYSHQPVVWTTHADWQKVSRTPETVVGSVLTIAGDQSTSGVSTAQLTELAQDTNTKALAPHKAVSALPSYKSENGSLAMMQAFLYGISGLVIAAFVAVWTVQRTRDIAVLKALGASNRYVLRDSLSQALVVTVLGSVIGGLAGFGLALAASSVVPIELTTLTVLGPIIGIVAIGMIASLLAVRQTTRINPLLALGGN